MDIACLVFDGITALDIIGPYDVLASVPDLDPVFVAEQTGPVRNEPRFKALVERMRL